MQQREGASGRAKWRHYRGKRCQNSQVINVSKLLDDRPLSWLQIQVIILCTVIQVLDGFDQQAIGYAAPAIADALGFQLSAFGPIIASTQVEFVIGAFLVAPFADRCGRKWLIIGSTTLYAIATLSIVGAGSAAGLVICRFLQGLGFGVSIPLCVSIASEYMPRSKRGVLVTVMWVGLPFGGMIAAFTSSVLIPAFGWQSIFYIGGSVPLVLSILLIWMLPESLSFLIVREASSIRIGQLLAKIASEVPTGSDTLTRWTRKSSPAYGETSLLGRANSGCHASSYGGPFSRTL